MRTGTSEKFGHKILDSLEKGTSDGARKAWEVRRRGKGMTSFLGGMQSQATDAGVRFDHDYDAGKNWIKAHGGELVHSGTTTDGTPLETHRVRFPEADVLMTWGRKGPTMPGTKESFPMRWETVIDRPKENVATPAAIPASAPQANAKESWQMTPKEFKAAQSQPVVDAVPDRIGYGDPRGSWKTVGKGEIRVGDAGNLEVLRTPPRAKLGSKPVWQKMESEDESALRSKLGIQKVGNHEAEVKAAMIAGKKVPVEVSAGHPGLFYHHTANRELQEGELKPRKAFLAPFQYASPEVPYEIGQMHRAAVGRAISEGKKVPREVLADYPEFKQAE